VEIIEIGAHPANLSVDLTALPRRIRAKKQEFPVVAADLISVSDRAIDFGPLTFCGSLVLRTLPRPGSIRDGSM